MRLYTLVRVLWTLRNHNNRKLFQFVIREYMTDVKLAYLLKATANSPYKIESLTSGINPKILLVVHQFSRTGAPYAVLYLARALFLIHSVRPVVISPEDGPLREEFIQEGFTTIVDPLLFNYRNYSSEAFDFVAKFDRVIVTSLSSFGFIRCFRGIGKHLSMWIHETERVFFEVANNDVDLPLLFAACESIWLGSPLCISPVLQYPPKPRPC